LKIIITPSIKGFSFIEEQALNLKRMFTMFLKMIGSGLSIGNKEGAKDFQKRFFGKIKNEYIQEVNGGKVSSFKISQEVIL